MDEMVLEVEGISKRYPKFELADVRFGLPRGYIMGFVGPNGAGKTTTIKIIMNLVYPDAGRVRVCGLDHRRREREVKSLVGYVGEEQSFYPEMTAGWTARFASNYYPTWDDGLYRRLMDRFELDERKKIAALSRGMKVKFALALALAHRPRLLILDEPTSGLDPIARREFLKELLDVIQDESRSVFFSSHITEDIEKVADFVTFINNGRVVLSGIKDDILSQWQRLKFRREALDDGWRRYLVSLRGRDGEYTGVTAEFPRLKRERPDLFAGGGLEAESMTLDEILISLVKGEA